MWAMLEVPTPSFSASPVSGVTAGGAGHGAFARTPPPGVVDPAQLADHAHAHAHAHHQHHLGASKAAAAAVFRPREPLPHPAAHAHGVGHPAEARPPSNLNAELRSNSGASNDDEDSDKIKVFLSRIRPPTVHEIGPREALVRWEALDCTEASAPGGPFPYIDSSEFTYEVLVTERASHRKATATRSLVHKIGDGDAEAAQQRLTDLRPSTDYTIKVRADLPDRGISGEPSHAVEFKTKPTQPDKPLAPFCQKRGRNFLNLAWKKPPDNGAKILAYHLEMEEGRGAWAAAYEDLDERARLTKLQPNTSYSFRLAARNQCGMSAWSDVLMAQTAGAPPSQPLAPALAHAEPDSLTLSWAKRGGDDRFSLQMDDLLSGHGFLPVADTADATASVKGLAKARAYAFRLQAENEDGKSPPSESVTFRTLASRPAAPARPVLKDRAKSTSLRLSWEPPKDCGGADVTGFLLECAADEPVSPSAWTTLYSGPAREYAASGLRPGTSYRFRLSCSGEGGSSSFSEPLAVSTTPLPPATPAAPTLVRAKPNSLHIRWQPPANTGGADITEYEVVLSSPAKPHPMAPATVFTGLKTEITLPNLFPGRVYHTKVRAVNKAGPSNWSGELTAETSAGAPDAVSALRLPATPTSTTVKLEWDPPLLTNGSPVHEYRLFQAEEDGAAGTASRDEDRFPDFVQAWSGTACSAEIRGLTPASAYAFQLRAANAAGLSTPSEILVVKTPPGPPAAPTNLQLEATGQTTVAATWDAPADSGAPITSFRLEVRGGPILEAEETHTDVPDLEPETSYQIRVAAVNDIGIGPWSSYVPVLTFSRPPAPPALDLVSAPAHNFLKLKWTDARPSAEAFTYQLEMENRSTTFSPIFEGTVKSHKVPNSLSLARVRDSIGWLPLRSSASRSRKRTGSASGRPRPRAGSGPGRTCTPSTRPGPRRRPSRARPRFPLPLYSLSSLNRPKGELGCR